MKTYGRPRIAEEALKCFLDQKFSGDAELIIVNDFNQQKLVFDHPQVKIFNFNKLFPTIGDSFDWGFHQGTGSYIVPWEDDDIYLPHSLQERFDGITSHSADYYKRPNAFVLNRGEVQEHGRNLFFCAGIWSRELYLKTNGCEHAHVLGDMKLEAAFKAKCDPERYFVETETDMNRTYYCYYWANRGVHLSGFGSENEKQCAEAAQKLVRQNCKERGTIVLKPQHRKPYYENVKRFIDGR